MPNATIDIAPVSSAADQAAATTLKSALQAYTLQEWESAARQLGELLLRSNSDQEQTILDQLGLALFQLKRFDEAAVCFEELLATTSNPELRRRTLVNLGGSYLKLADFELAEKHLRQSLGTKRDGVGRYNMACLRTRQGAYDEALDWLQQALELLPQMKPEARESEDFAPLRPYVRFEKLVEEEPDWFLNFLGRFFLVLFSPIAAVFWFAQCRLSPFQRLAKRWYANYVRNSCGDWNETHGFSAATPLTGEAVDETWLEQLKEALTLIRECDPLRFRRIKQDIKWIVIAPTELAGAFIGDKTCELDPAMFSQHSISESCAQPAILEIAILIVHEATHARLSSHNVKQNGIRRIGRVEQLCRKQERHFAARVARHKPKLASLFDTNHAARYSVWHRWFYERRQSLWTRLRERFKDHEDPDSVRDEEFQKLVWSDVDRFCEYFEDRRNGLSELSNDSLARYNRANDWCSLRQYDLAKNDLLRATELDPDTFGYWMWLGMRAFDIRDLDLALHALQRAHQLGPSDRACLQWLITVGAAHEGSHRKSIVGYGEKLVTERGDDHKSYLYLAKALCTNERHAEALELLHRAMTYHPDSLRGLLFARYIYTQLGKHAQAAEYWKRYIHALRAKINNCKRPFFTDAVLLSIEEKDSFFALRVLFASKKSRPEFLRGLGNRVLNETLAEPESVADRYLHAMIRSTAWEGQPFELPVSIAGRRNIQVVDLRVPAQEFADRKPQPLATIPFCVDRANPWYSYVPQNINR